MRKNLKGCKKLARETLAGNFTVPVIGSIQFYPFSGDLRLFRRTLPDLPEYFQKRSLFFRRSSVLFQPPAGPCNRGILCAGTDQSGDVPSTGVVFLYK